MLRTFLSILAGLLLAVPLSASSYYTSRIADPQAIYLTRSSFPVKGDGIADDTDAVQQAIDKVQETTNQGILFVPAGRYRLTKTIYIWPGIRVIGFGSTRPAFVLGANTTGFQRGPAYMVFFAGGRPGNTRKFPQRPTAHDDNIPEDASPGTVYSAL